MGYATAGYPTRRHKRRKYAHQHFLILEDIDDGAPRDINGKKRKGKVRRTNVVGKFRAHDRITSLQDLPVEIIQHIFVLSQNTQSMTVLNKFFYQYLKPSHSLVYELLWEKFTFDPIGKSVPGSVCPPGQVMMVDSIFSNDLFYRFLAHYHSSILDRVFAFIPNGLHEDFQVEHNLNDILCWLEKDVAKDFPKVFYKNFDAFFSNKKFIIDISRYFTLLQPYTQLESLISWFFTEQSRFTVSELFPAINLILRIADIQTIHICSSTPITTLVEMLFVNKDTTELRNILEDSDETNWSRLDCIKHFLDEYYSGEGAKQYLSDPALWELLRNISNMELIDVIVEYGGDPQFDVFF